MNKIQVPIKYKEPIMERFNYENKGRDKTFINNFGIHKGCVLCEESRGYCDACLFDEFKSDDHVGCINWVDKFIHSRKFTLGISSVRWHKQDDQIVKEQLEKFREILENEIEWVRGGRMRKRRIVDCCDKLKVVYSTEGTKLGEYLWCQGCYRKAFKEYKLREEIKK